jgi:hypothetical protein
LWHALVPPPTWTLNAGEAEEFADIVDAMTEGARVTSQDDVTDDGTAK